MILGSRLQRIMAAVSVTVLTLAVIGVVLLSTTPLGCGPANAVHLKLSTNRCTSVASKLSSPSPFPTYNQAPSPFPNPNPGPPSTNPAPEPASNPYPQPASNPYPQPGSGNPYPDSTSGGFPTFGNPASGPGAPGFAINCRLPIYAGGPGSGGFIVFPGGNFIADPRSAVAVPSPSPGAPSPTPPSGPGPGYQGFYGMSYDQVDSRWLPVPYRWVSHSPAGMVYAYPGQSDGVYVQNITAGTSTELGQGKSWQVLDVTQVGVFASTGTTGGLWLLRWDGSVVQRIGSGYWQGISPLNAVAYGTATSGVPQGAGNTIQQYDFGTGATTDYFSIPGRLSSLGGFDPAGNPVFDVQGQQGYQIYVGLGPNRANQIADLSGSNFYPNGLAISDQHGLWLAGYNGIALHVPGAWYGMSSFGGQLAGGCY
jgi:hypothetical protein